MANDATNSEPTDSIERRRSAVSIWAGLDWLSTAIVLIDDRGSVVHLNPAAEQLFELSRRSAIGQPLATYLVAPLWLEGLIESGVKGEFELKLFEIELVRLGRDVIPVNCSATLLGNQHGFLLLEFSEIPLRARVEREERLLEQAEANRELVRNLAHEIKNPLGGIRGAAQLLETELASAGQREYTQVIIKEAGRLQSLVDRLLAPHRKALLRNPVNIHEVCERVRLVCLSQYPDRLRFTRDYDASLPEFLGDREQMIQVVLNLVQNAIQAMHAEGTIRLVTRIRRQAIIARKRHKLALELHVIDNGPGIPADIRSRIFFPLVSGREGGSGLGLSLAQSYVQQHGGSIEFESSPGGTDFCVLLPLENAESV